MEVINNPPNESWNRPHNIPEFRVDPVMVLIFSFLTCGLYLIYWNVKIAEVLNAVSEREIISTPLAVFSGCCLPVHVYFYYIIGKDGLPKVYKLTGELQKDQSTLLIVLGLLFPMAAAMIVQGDINRLYR
ncbi:DUF4234 domain-containing protein [Flavobacterium sp. XGLA_31]|uniref:DUF4234 domain-containing protein n=1 Tax=Flavobacterium sp. XGLA_31 TaxID=3447666 RepID=UPI003F382B46